MWERCKQLGSLLLLMLLLGATTAAFGWKAYCGFHATVIAKEWPQARAVVVEQVRQDEPFDRVPRWTVGVRFVYTVDGKEFVGQERRYGQTVSEADDFLAKYAKDREFTIHYNPDSPDDVALDASLSAATFLYLAFAVLGALGTAGMLCSFFRGLIFARANSEA